MERVIRLFNGRMGQGLKSAIRSIDADGDSVVIFFDAQGVAKDGKPYTNTYAWFFDMRDGRVVRAHAFYDALTFRSSGVDSRRRMSGIWSGPRVRFWRRSGTRTASLKP